MQETHLHWLYPLIASIISLSMARVVWPHRGNPSARYLFWSMMSFSLWFLAYTLEYYSPALADKLFWVNIEYVGVYSTPPLYLAFCLSVGKLRHLITPSRVAGVCLVPLLGLLAVWTNPWHHLMWERAWLEEAHQIPLVAYDRALGFWLMVVYCYGLLALGTGIMIRVYWRAHELQRKRLRMLFLGLFIPWLGNALYLLFGESGPYLDPTPLAFTVTGFCLTWGLFRYQLLDILPLARRFVMESMADPILVFNLEGRLTDLNSAARLLWDQDASTLLGRTAAEVFKEVPPHPQGSKPLPWRGKVVLPQNGQSRIYDCRISPLRDRFLGVVGSLMILRDITDQERAAQLMQASAERHRRLLDNLPDPVLVYDMNGQMLYNNPAFASTFGWSRQEISSGQAAFVPPQALDETQQKVAIMLDRQPVRDFHTQRCTVDGRTLQVLINTEPFHDDRGEQIGNIVLMRDITALKEYQDSLRLSERRNRAILEAAADPIAVFDTQLRVLFFNPAHEKTFGWTLRETQGRPLRELVSPEYWPQAQALFTEVLQSQSLIGKETQVPDNHGELIPVSISGAVIKDDQGIVEGSVICLRDLRRTKELEAQLLQAQKMEAIGTLAGGVAHEFNNILMAIQGYTQLLSLRGDLSPQALDYLGKIDQSCGRAADLSANMLSLSRPRTGRLEPVRLDQLLERMRRLVQQTFSPNLEVEVEVAPDLPLVMANPNQLEQVLLNLALNARDAMPKGGRLSLGASVTELDGEFCQIHPWAQVGPYLEIRVTDSGHGMTSQVVKRIFEPFFSTKEPGKGTGLGLSVAYSVIANHHGGILVSSQPGQGTQFTIYLPAQPNASLAAALPSPIPAPPRGQGQKILVVDDEDPVREIVGHALSEVGYMTVPASDGSQALAQYQAARDSNEPFALVIMDLSMPVMDGRQCARRLLEMDPLVRVLIASGHLDLDHRTAGLEACVKGILHKPYDLKQLVQVVGDSLGQG